MPLNNLGTATGNIKINTSDLKNADIALRSAGRGMIYMGAAAVGAFGTVVNEAAKFEKEMDFVQAVTASSGEQMDVLKQKAIELGKESVFGPVELAQAFTDLAKAGASVEDIIGGVGEASVQLAQAADVEIPFAGENLINILNTFKLEAGDAAHVADILAGAANASSVELADIVTTMRYAGPVAQALGIDIEEVNDAISVLGRVGIKGSIAGTSLRFAMTHLIPDTKKAQEAITSLGLHIDETTGSVVEFSNTDGSLKDLADIFQILQDRTKDLTDQQRIAVVNDIFGVRAMPSVIELMNAGKAGFQELHDEIAKTTAADVAAQRLDNLAGSIAKLKATIKTLMTEAGGPFQGVVKDWVDGLRELLLAFDALPGPVKTFLVSGLLVVGVLSLLAGGFLLTIGNIVRAVRVFGEIINAFSLFSSGASGAAAANSTLSASLLASPIFWLILLILALVAAFVVLWMKCEGFRDFWKDLWADIKRIAQDAWEWIKGVWDDVVEFFDDIGHAWEGFVNAFKGEGITTSLKDITGWAERLGNALGIAWRSAKDFVSVGWDAVANFFSDGIEGMGIGLQIFIDSLQMWWDDISGFFGQLPGLVKGAVGDVIETITSQFAKLSFRNIGYAFGFAIGAMIKLPYLFYRTVVEWLTKIVTQFAQWGIQVLTQLSIWEHQLLDWAGRVLASFFQTIWGWLSQIPGIFIQFMSEVLIFLYNLAPQMASAALNIGMSIYNGIIDFVSKIPGAVLQFLVDTAGWLLDKLPDFASGALDIGLSVFNGIIDEVTKIPGKVLEFLTNAVNTVKGMVSSAYGAAKSFGKGLWDGFKDGIGIGSPSHIERALMAIDDQATATGDHLRRTVQSMNGLSATIPVSTGNLTSPMNAAAAQNGTWNQNAPLVGTAYVRSDQDIVQLSRDLQKERARQARARGVVLAPTWGGTG